MAWLRTHRDRGLSFVELVCVAAVAALLLAMGFVLYGGMREAARVCEAESNLKQVATGMELYFRKFSSYPPQGSDLTQELAPFVDNPNVFGNPLLEEQTPGETINALYKEPSLADIDRPNQYLTAMVSDNGRTAVILRTGDRIERRSDLHFDPSGPAGDLLAVLDPVSTVTIITSASGNETKVKYTIVRDEDDSIKYEEAATGLGEDGAEETDTFKITVVGAVTSCTVKTKAGNSSGTNVLSLTTEGAFVLDDLGFLTMFVCKENDTFTISVSSVENEHALSYVEFTFPNGVVQVPEGDYEIIRTTKE